MSTNTQETSWSRNPTTEQLQVAAKITNFRSNYDKLPKDITLERIEKWDEESETYMNMLDNEIDLKYSMLYFIDSLRAITTTNGIPLYTEEDISDETFRMGSFAVHFKELLWEQSIKYLKEAKTYATNDNKMKPVFRARLNNHLVSGSDLHKIQPNQKVLSKTPGLRNVFPLAGTPLFNEEEFNSDLLKALLKKTRNGTISKKELQLLERFLQASTVNGSHKK